MKTSIQNMYISSEIAENGKVKRAKWEYLDKNTLLIDCENECYLFRHGFFDSNILALKIDGKQEYAFLVNEIKFNEELNSYNNVIKFLDNTYLQSPISRSLPAESMRTSRIIHENYLSKYYCQPLDDTADLFGKFLTEESEITKKIGKQQSTMWKFRYAKGILENEIQKDIASTQPPIELHQYGMHIEIKINANKYYNLVVGFNEIQDILYDQELNLVTFYLFNEMSLQVIFDVIDDSIIELKKLCTKYIEVSGKTPTANYLFK